ncbi:MAG: hypothetical protein DMF04_07665 [Verrucomicrobia bacterium]|nr:MAG: hypothetical protein DMF04_07665 [Verrucomicrobiota bacterium]
MKSINAAMFSYRSAKPQLSGSPLLPSVALRTGTQTKGFVAGGLFFGVIEAAVSAHGQVIVNAGPRVPSNVSPSNLFSVAPSPNPPTISK